MSNLRVSLFLRAGVAALAFACWPTLPLHAAEQPGTSVIGSWKLTGVLDSSDISSMDDQAAADLVGRIMTIGRDKVQLGDRVCDAPDFEVTKAETNRYFRQEAHASAKKLGLPNPVTAVHVSCTYVCIKSRNRLVVHWKGFFFDAVRMPSKGKHPAAPAAQRV